MGIGFWFKRLFGRSAEGDPCALCHSAIPATDLRKGFAVRIARQLYCRGCVEEITRRTGDRPGLTLSADIGSSSTVLLR